MLTLSRATTLTRAVLRWGAIAIVALIALNILFKVGGAIKNSLFPPPPPAPTVAFGKLPTLKFPQNTITGEFSYTLETVSGILPVTPLQINVYKTVQNQPGLLSLQKARDRVSKAGFTKQEKQISSRVYQWTDDFGRTISFDIISNDFDLTSNFLQDQKILTTKNLPNQEKAKTTATKLLERLDLLPKEFTDFSFRESLLAIKNNNLMPATSRSQADIVRLDFFPGLLDDKPIVYPQKNQALINFLVAENADDAKAIVEARYFYRAPDLKNSTTYPIKTADQVWQELTDNQGFITGLDNKNIKAITVRNVYLGYYSSSQTQDFYYPIFVFEGDNGFLGYVSAIDPAWLEEPTQ